MGEMVLHQMNQDEGHSQKYRIIYLTLCVDCINREALLTYWVSLPFLLHRGGRRRGR